MLLDQAESLSILVSTKSRKSLSSDVVLRLELGGDNHLAVVLHPYASTVQCEDSDVLLSWESCSIVERGMEADEVWRSFGYRSVDPEVEEPLPYDLESRQLSPHSSAILLYMI